jgi:hypothetical protein
MSKRHGLRELNDKPGRISVLRKMQALGSTRLQHTRPRREYDERMKFQSRREEEQMTLEMAKAGLILKLET